MAVLTFPKSMLYCPKCSNTYEEGTQRFCSNDGVRLLSSSAKSPGQTKSVFTNALKKSNQSAVGGKPANFFKTESQPPSMFSTPVTADSFRSAATEKTAKTENVSFNTDNSAPAKPAPRLIKPGEVAFSQAKLGDRSVNPTGRLALTWENTAILLGQTIKGRYYIVSQLSEDETSVAYLAEDKIVSGKKVVVRVLMDDKDINDYERKIFAEERVSLSHINHPNVAHLFDSGELLEGKDFIVSEYVEGVSLKEKLRTSSQFNAHRAAKIIRQAADALGEVHANGILHRNLKPENIILTVSQSGTEQIKVTDFAVFDGLDEPTEESLKYLSPEQLEGRVPNFASDIYSLAAIAYQMLTGRVPFNFSGEREILKAQKEGLSLRPTNLRLDLSPQTDQVLQKALAYKSSERYPKARDFGDALYNALTATVSSEKPSEKALPAAEKSIPKIETFSIPAPDEILELEPEILEIDTKPETEKEETIKETPEIIRGKILPVEAPVENDAIEIAAKGFEESKPELPEAATESSEETEQVETPKDLSWERRSPEPIKTASSSRMFFWTIGLLLLAIVAVAGWIYVSKHSVAPIVVSPNNAETSAASPNDAVSAENKKPEPSPMEIEAPPLTRQIAPPPNSTYFQNSRENFSGELAKNFRGFSFYYPNDWVKNSGQTNFADVARIGATGTPIEQFLVSYYDSKGTYTADREIFPELAEQSQKDLEKALNGKFNLLSQGETRINGDWKAYEMKFQGEGVTVNGDKITLWGRRLWLPAARPGIRTGFVLTLLATSISPEVKSADDVGIKGELAQVLATFEPDSLDTAY